MAVSKLVRARGIHKINRSDIERGMLHCNSMVQLAEYLDIKRQSLRVHMDSHLDENGVSLYQNFCKKIKEQGRGRKSNLDRDFITHLLEIGLLGNKMPPSMVKDKLLDEGYFEKKCMCCGFSDYRKEDAKYPLLINFKDGKRSSWKRENLEILCYNCYYIKVGDLMFKDQLEALEFYGQRKRREVFGNVNSEAVLDQAKAYKSEIDALQQDYEQTDQWANDIIAFNKLKK